MTEFERQVAAALKTILTPHVYATDYMLEDLAPRVAAAILKMRAEVEGQQDEPAWVSPDEELRILSSALAALRGEQLQ